MASFYVVATPIGNLEDITLRALNVLKGVDFVFCEDTRITKRLLDRHDIHVPTKSYHAHSKLSRTEEILKLLKDGKNIALVSDAGTPGISDPGSKLVNYLRQELKEEIFSGAIKIEAIPGPSALTAALSIAGISCADFTFLGFLPHKKGRETLFKEILTSKRTIVFYESPHRIMKTLDRLVEGKDEDFGRNVLSKISNDGVLSFTKKITICRELTKIFEEVVSGSFTEVRDYFTKNLDKVRGEFVVIISA